MTSTAKLPGEQRSELQHPTPDCFIGDIQPALGEQILDVAEAEGEAKVQPYRMPDNVRRELVASERDRCQFAIIAASLKPAKVSVSIPAYVLELSRLGIAAEMFSPVAQSNVCPEGSPPFEPSIYAFSFTTVTSAATPSFIISGSGEVTEGQTNYHDHIIRLGDWSASGLAEKSRYVLGEMESRLTALDLRWRHTTSVQVYTIRNFHPSIADAIVRRDAACHGLTWHYARPPIVGLEFEMDCRGVQIEHVFEPD